MLRIKINTLLIDQVGLRWWNYIDENGDSQWMFEKRNGDSQQLLSATEVSLKPDNNQQ